MKDQGLNFDHFIALDAKTKLNFDQIKREATEVLFLDTKVQNYMHCLANGIFVPQICFENEHNSILHLLA